MLMCNGHDTTRPSTYNGATLWWGVGLWSSIRSSRGCLPQGGGIMLCSTMVAALLGTAVIF